MSGWNIVDHACRYCLGRLLERDGESYCPTCEAKGRPNNICGCAVVSETGRRLFRCAPNPTKTPANPAEIVIVRLEGSSAAAF